jgi:ketosteroid isomerase-like protein
MAPLSSAAYVTAVLRFLQAFNAGDLDECEKTLAPDVEWHTAVTYKGPAEVRRYLETLSERFNKPQLRPDDFREASGHVLMIVTLFDTEPGDEPVAEQRHSWLADVGETGSLRRVVSYPTPAEAARALDALTHKVNA